MTLSDALAPAVSRWAQEQERRILREGEPLGREDGEFARSLGIGCVAEVRILEVEAVPLPVPAFWVRLAGRCGLPVFAPGGMALGRGIYLLPRQRASLRHELVHVAQYERLGGIRPFMSRYLAECLMTGYAEAPLELEAQVKSNGWI